MARYRAHGYLVISLAATLLVMGWMPALPQDPAYHQFADTRTLFGLPNAVNVLTNLPFILVGGNGLWRLRRRPGSPLCACYALLFGGMCLTGLGSAYYHWQPDNHGLLWDRLPLAVTLSAYLALLLGHHLSLHLGRHLLWPLVLAGLGAVLYWYGGELAGRGDLRPYLLIQGLPLLLTPLLLIGTPNLSLRGPFVAIFGCYLAAKGCELADSWLYEQLTVLSGHSLKHLAAALGGWWLVVLLDDQCAREKVTSTVS